MAWAMTPFRRHALIPALTSLIFAGMALEGCTQRGTYPSLARRPQETDEGRIASSLPAPAIAEPAGPTNPVAPAALAELRSRAEAAHQRFAAQRSKDGPAIVAGRTAAQGTEAWALGSVALADLVAEHDATVAALAEIDGLYAADRIDGGDGGAIAAVRDQVTAWVADEDAVLAELGRQ